MAPDDVGMGCLTQAVNGGSPEKVLQGQTKADVVTDCRSMYDILTRTAVPSCSEHQTTIASSDQGRVERQL